MYLTSLSLLLLWHSTQILSHPVRPTSPRPRAIGVSYDLTRAKTPVSSSDSDATTSWGQLQDNAQRQKYLLAVEVEGQSFDLEIDTGSSDTWIIQTGFSCYDTYDSDSNTFTGSEPQSHCNFGATYSPGAGFDTISDVYELSCYGQTEKNKRCVSGAFGLASLSFAGYTVDDQVLGAPDLSSYPAAGQPEQSGILGLAFSTLTSAYNSADGSRIPATSVMQNLFSSGAVSENIFSIALSRDNSNNGNGGVFSIGGVPDPSHPQVNVSIDAYTSAPLIPFASVSATELSFYSIEVDSLVLGNAAWNQGLQIVIDSGAPTFQVPTATADAMNSYWSPAMDSNGGLSCDAVLLEPVGIAIGGATYYVNSQDLIGQSKDGSCYSSISGSDGALLLIGDPFLKSVLAVFDWDSSVMSFYPRPYYES